MRQVNAAPQQYRRPRPLLQEFSSSVTPFAAEGRFRGAGDFRLPGTPILKFGV